MGDRRDHRSADPLHARASSPTTRAATSFPICRSPTTRSGCAATASSTRRSCAPSPASISTTPRCEAPNDRRCRALLSGDLLVHDDEAAAGEGLRRLDRHPEEHHARHLASAHEQRRLRRLPSARPGGDAHHSGAIWAVQVRRRRVDAPHLGGTGWRDDDQPHRRPARRRALQIFRRLDRPRRQGRTAQAQAVASVGHRAQPRRHHMGLVDARQVSARPDLVRSAQADGQRQRPALRRAGIFDRQHADPRSQDPQGLVLQDAGGGPEHADIARPGRTAAAVKPTQPSAYWGDRKLWDTKANQHNAMFDKKGRVWLAAGVRGIDNPAWCKKGSEHPSAKVFPLEQSPAGRLRCSIPRR